MSPTTAPCGSWASPITASLITSREVSLAEPRFSAGSLYWLEGRPLEGGRVVLASRGDDGSVRDVVDGKANVRTRVHEYGGGAYFLHGKSVFFSDYRSQRIYRQDPGTDPRPLTPAPSSAAEYRYADGCVSPDGRWIFCVREIQAEKQPVVNDIVLLPSDGSSNPRSIISGTDFYSFPRVSPDGSKLLWTSWNHPRMPWDGTELYSARLDDTGSVFDQRLIAGGKDESIFQPEWAPDGSIFFASDRTGWWNLYNQRERRRVAIAPMEAEFGYPQWVFGLSRYAFVDPNRLAAVYTRDGTEHVAVIDPASGALDRMDLGYTSIFWLVSDGADRIALVAASPSRASELALVDVKTGALDVVKRSVELDIDSGYLSSPSHIEFPTTGDGTAFAFFYPPTNKDYESRPEERPPLIVTSHGGPTATAFSALNLSIQFWTSRGFGVVDVNYGGSTGYGRAYRERLEGEWGIVDTDDCVNAALFLAGQGDADRTRMAIRGKSASGFTTLCALVFHDVFAAGASYYGVADLRGLVAESHKFEARYLDGLIGPYPEAEELYRERSPLEHAARLSTPVILMQGLEDRVVPPSQAEVLVGVLREKKLPFAYVAFEEEGHGFRKAANIKRALEAELYFYSRVFGFRPADDIEPLVIENLP